METNKRFEFLQSMVTAVDAHLRYFERGYQLFAGLEPYLQHALQVRGFCTSKQPRLRVGWGHGRQRRAGPQPAPPPGPPTPRSLSPHSSSTDACLLL